MNGEIKQVIGDERLGIYGNMGGIREGIADKYNKLTEGMNNYFEEHPRVRKAAPFILMGVGLAAMKLSGGLNALDKHYAAETFEEGMKYLRELPAINRHIHNTGVLTACGGFWQAYQDTVSPLVDKIIPKIFGQVE